MAIDFDDHTEVPLIAKESDRRLGAYWKNNVSRAFHRIPAKLSFVEGGDQERDDIWDRLEKRLRAEKMSEDGGQDERPYVNEYRKLIETQLAFYDQQEPHFKVVPDEQFIALSNADAIPTGKPEIDEENARKARIAETALKRAECVAAYLKKTWNEQKCQKAESRKLYDTTNLNIGFTMPDWDDKKLMPFIRYLPARHVGIDPDCNGNIEDANWIGYKEWVTLETFKAMFPKVSAEVITGLSTTAKSTLSEHQAQEAGDEVTKMHQTIEITHIFARNAATQGPRKETDEDEKPLEKEEVLERRYFTPRRYIVLVDGYAGTILDLDKWPYDLDHDELPITPLQFNVVNNYIYGFTDYVQMERLDQLGDTIIGYLKKASRDASIKKFGSSTTVVLEDGANTNIDDFLNNPNTSHLKGLVDAEGKQLVQPIDRGTINEAQLNVYGLVKQETADATALRELTTFNEAQQYKDVTALAARILEANAHQKVNRRLNGPWGYESSITEDAIKFLEIAFEEVPKRSILDVIIEREPEPFSLDEEGARTERMEDVEWGARTERMEDVEWAHAKKLLISGSSAQQAINLKDVQLFRMGVDAIVGPELAEFWPCDEHIVERRLMMKITVEPGSSRSTTRLEQAAMFKQLYVELFEPFYTATMDRPRQRDFLEMIGNIANIPNLDGLLPSRDEIQKKAPPATMPGGAPNVPGEAGGQPLNSPQANVNPQYQEPGLG